MRIDLEDTNAAQIAQAMIKARRASGSPAMDMVLTLLVVTDEEGVGEALDAATSLAKEHPARVLGVILGSGRGAPRLDAKVRVGEDGSSSGESILMRMSGPLVKHAESVVIPLLLPDSPVVVWWPGVPPVDPSSDPIGALATRRLTDAESATNPVRALRSVARHYRPGDTDLTWTRLTPWRALLAAALDQTQATITGGEIVAGGDNPTAVLLRAWLEDRLGVRFAWSKSEKEQIGLVRLTTAAGDIRIERDDEGASFSVPGSAPRTVPLGTRTLPQLLAEDLRRMDADDVYAATVQNLLKGRA